ncbi:hypothetical protein [Bradyrhizobium roseum]|uniref:hypothetical protein n=1 Tax=Bradyrhizobium roseum TaxID=3056648 RepID=UPI00262FA33E|nr:hypothetical protein [Bradyrhizobium roseus]WKA30175.1 hypothetical protein QUH67_08415 [Bradyrhizobium roseus]
MAAMVWIPLACLVWLVAGAMALHPATRRKGLALALAMAATFPAVFLFQAAAAPLLAAMVLGAVWLSGILDPASTVTQVTTSGLAIATLSGTLLLAFHIMLAVSIIGFFEGWLLGWRYAYGERFREVIKRGPTARLLRRLGVRKLQHAT